MTECEVKEKTGGPGTFPLSRNPIVRGSVKKTREFFEKQASASSDREVTKTNASPHAVPPVLKKSPSSASTLPTALSNRNISIPKDTSVKETTLTRDSRPAVGITDRSRSRSKVENMWQHYDKTKNKIFHSQRYTSVSNDNCGQLAAGMMDSRNVVKTHPSGNRLKSSTMTKFHSFREAYKQDYECALSRKTGGDSVRRSKSVECTVNRRYIFKNIKSIFEKPFTGTKGLKVKTVSELPTHSVPFLVSEIKERDSIDNEQSMIKTISQNACVFVGTKKPAAVDFTREDPISTEITEPNFSCEMNKSTSPVNGSNTIRAENAQKAKVCALKIESTFRRDTKDLASSMPTVVANAELTQVIPTYHDTEIVDQADFNDVTITECKVISNDVTEATPDLTTSNTMSSSCFPEAVMSFAKDDIDQFIPHHLCQLKYAAESEDREWAGNTEDLQVPKVEGQQDKQRVTYGGRAVLQCHVVGHPLPDIAWTLNHSVIKPSRYFQQSYKDSIAQLVVAEAFSEDEGEYTCSATNMAGNDSSSCFLVVEEKLPFTPHKVTLKTDTKFEDHYCYLNELGKGKFGSVFKCQEKKTGKLWAAKLLKVRSTQKEAVRMEVDIMNKLIHPKLLMLWDAFEAARTMVLVMEFVGAGELFERVIREDFVLTERDCVHFMRQICCGVGYMHSQSILHLDLKPENILCVSHNSNEIKIIDFGLARHYKEGDSLHILCGTPEFVAPEVVGYDDISFATDMWSVGVICYVLLSGLSPFLGDTEAETLTNVTSGDFDFDDDNFDGISDNAKDFIIQLLIKQKEKRHSVKQCEHHSWLAQDTAHIGSARLSTNNLKSYMARRKWQKTGNAIRALGRMSSLQRSTSIGSGSNSCGSDSMSVQKDVSCPDGVTLDSSFRQQVSGGLLASLEQEREQQAPEPPAEQNTQQQVSEPPAEQNTPQQTSEPPVSLQQRQ